VCRSCVRILKQNGLDDVANITGGHLSMVADGSFHGETT
jgi:hypothetical protein